MSARIINILSRAAAMAAVGLASCAAPDPLVESQAPLRPRPSDLSAYKVLTYNTQFRPPIVDAIPGDSGDAGSNLDIYGLEDEVRAQLIAEKIVASRADVVALQEVFRPRAYDALVDSLGVDYSSYTRYDDLLDSDPYGSGMVLFSKFSMRSLGAVDTFGERRRCLRQIGDECFAELLEYQAQAQLAERLTRKGMGYAMLDNPRSNRPLHVLFTHFEAGFDQVETRDQQIAEAMVFIKERLEQANGDDVILLGDLNIRAPEVGESPGPRTEDYRLHITRGLGDLELIDSARSQSRDDNAFTFDGPENTASTSTAQARLDYLLLRSPLTSNATTIPRSCAQHAVVERFRSELLVDGNQVRRDLSDHFAVSLLIGPEANQCDPVRARGLDELSDASPEISLAQQIAHPGSVQWYRFDKPGSYTVRAFRADDVTSEMRVVAFAASNLSSPMAPIEGTELVSARGGRVIYFSEQPFYVRVDSPDPAWRGAYSFTARRHQGVDFADAIILAPGVPFEAAQMTSAVSQPIDRVHFRFQQHALQSGEPQHLRFELTTSDALRMAVFDAQRQALPGLVSSPPQTTLDVASTTSPISGLAQTLFLTVDRSDCLTCQDAPFAVQWSSDHRQLQLGELTVEHQTEGIGQLEYDEITVYMSVDGGAEHVIFTGELDRFASTYLDVPAAIGFRSSVKLRVVEDDVGIDDTFNPVVFGPQVTSLVALAHFYANGTVALGHYTVAWNVTR